VIGPSHENGARRRSRLVHQPVQGAPVLTAPDIVELLDSRVVSSHFSPKLPHWSPGEWFDDLTGKECPSSTDVGV
jgi:hypothetical protein